MKRSTHIVRLVLLVSCAHALVHLLEQSVASMEQVISDDFQLDGEGSGLLGSALRFPYGIGAFFAGLLADRFGSRRILVLYLAGSGIVCGTFLLADSSTVVYSQLFLLGAFASMYHPAGLALLANETTIAERPRALGLHGVFGSLGIASAPFLAGLLLTVRPGDWKGYYLLLGLIALALAVLVWLLLKPVHDRTPRGPDAVTAAETSFQLWPYVLLVTGTALGGTVYGGVLHFLPRYLEESGSLSFLSTGDNKAAGNFAAALALVCGAFGQWLAGRVATPRRLPLQLAAVYFLNIPFLLAMPYFNGSMRLLTACLWAFFHFMNQPFYNSLVAEFLPRHRRSLGFGFSNMMGFGVGAVGPYLIGSFHDRFQDYTLAYFALAGLALLAAVLPLPLLMKGFAIREGDLRS